MALGLGEPGWGEYRDPGLRSITPTAYELAKCEGSKVARVRRPTKPEDHFGLPWLWIGLAFEAGEAEFDELQVQVDGQFAHVARAFRVHVLRHALPRVAQPFVERSLPGAGGLLAPEAGLDHAVAKFAVQLPAGQPGQAVQAGDLGVVVAVVRVLQIVLLLGVAGLRRVLHPGSCLGHIIRKASSASASARAKASRSPVASCLSSQYSTTCQTLSASKSCGGRSVWAPVNQNRPSTCSPDELFVALDESVVARVARDPPHDGHRHQRPAGHDGDCVALRIGPTTCGRPPSGRCCFTTQSAIRTPSRRQSWRSRPSFSLTRCHSSRV